MDATNFKKLFLPYHQKLFRVAFRLLGNAQEAEDMVQEAYLKLWKKRDELTDINNVEAYSVALIKNLCFDAMRLSRFDEDERCVEELNICSDYNMVKQIELKDEVHQVYKLIEMLPEQQRKIIIMRDVKDCSFDEIEKITGLKTINVRVLLSRARKSIREQFNGLLKYEHK